ncbi:MAG: tRNA glutamyl-Q(34) synthetase GluQRS [Actinomycetaceae bacterium]|nr:tRNA glutamyl-Q(34) synthetase GluQRS [Actinomycetaceae bacterium]
MKSQQSAGRGYGRYAPSPTGDLHLGNLRTALLAWSFARNAGLGFLMRMEDIDERSRPHFVTRQLEDLEALGIDWDGDVIFQSQNQERYEAVFADLRARGELYECYCTRRELAAAITSAPHMPLGAYTGTCRGLSESERGAKRAELAALGREVAFRLDGRGARMRVCDAIVGDYEGVVDDFIVRRGDGVFSYNFVSVIDDGVDGVRQIVRGDDLLSSAPRQAYLGSLLGFEQAEYIHVPMVVNGEGVRLSKRDGAVTMRALAEYGWSAGDVVEFLGRSLGFDGVRVASEFAECVAGVGVSGIAGEPYRFDPSVVASE